MFQIKPKSLSYAAENYETQKITPECIMRFTRVAHPAKVVNPRDKIRLVAMTHQKVRITKISHSIPHHEGNSISYVNKYTRPSNSIKINRI